MNKDIKYNPIRICSCSVCKGSSTRRFWFKVANRKFRHQSNQQLKSLSDYDEVDRIMIAGGYTD